MLDILLWTLAEVGLTDHLMASESSKKPESKRGGSDVVLVYGQSEDGKGYGVLRQRGSEVQVGTMRRLGQGKPIHGEVIRLKPREDSPVLFDVEVQHDARPPSGRPAKVATDQYRKGWESIWSKKRPDRNRKIVALCDVSGSMSVYAKVFLAFLAGLITTVR